MEKSMMDNDCEIFCHNVSWLRKHYGLSKKTNGKADGDWNRQCDKAGKGDISTKDVHKCSHINL